jgi:hypothetical protein
MTMHPDPHPPHPVRPFGAEPPAYRRYPIAEPPPRRSAWRIVLAVGLAILEAAVFIVALLAAVLLAPLILFGDAASINAWGLWLRGIFGGW